MKLTERQEAVLSKMQEFGRRNLFRYKEHTPYLFGNDCEKVKAGDAYYIFGLGVLSYQIGYALELPAAAVLSTFKALERKGLVMRETSHPTYHRPLYWWPVGLAAELAEELSEEALK